MSKKPNTKESDQNDFEVDTIGEKPKSGLRIFTYVGSGEDSPRVIEFMGIQRFVLGKVTEVADPRILAKIINNPSFVEGKVGEEEIFQRDEKAKKEAEEKRKTNKVTDLTFNRKHRGE